MERRYRAESVDTQLQEQSELGIHDDHCRRSRVHRRHQRSQDSCVRCEDWKAAMGIADAVWNSRSTNNVSGRWETIHRGSLRMGWGLRGNGVHAESGFPGAVSRRAGWWVDLGL